MADNDFLISDEALKALESGGKVKEYRMCLDRDYRDGEEYVFIGFNNIDAWLRVLLALKDHDGEFYQMFLRCFLNNHLIQKRDP